MSEANDPGHGHSPAAWTAVVIILLAFTIGTFAFWFELAWLVWASVGLAVIGFVVGGILRAVGYGVGGVKVATKSH